MNRRFGFYLPALVLLLLVFIIPPLIPIHLFPEGSFWNEWSAGVLVVLAWSFVWFEWSKSVSVPNAILLWVLWGGGCAASAFKARYSLISPVYMAGIFWFLGALCLFLIGALKNRLNISYIIIFISVVLVFSGIAQSLLDIARFYGALSFFSGWLSPISGVRRLAGLLNYPTTTGFSIWLSIVALVHLFWEKKVGWVGLLVACIPMSFAIIATGDRASLLYALGMFAVAILISFRGTSFKEIKFTNALHYLSALNNKGVIGAGAVLIIMLASIPTFNLVDHNLGSYAKSLGYINRTVVGDHSFRRAKSQFWGIRGSEFRKALYLAKHHFWLGVGPGNYPYQSFRLDSVLKNTVREDTVTTHSHNIFSMVLAEEGVVGLVVLSIGIFFMVVWWWRFEPGGDSFFTGSILLLFFIYSNLEYPLWYLNFFVIFMIFCGLISPVKSFEMDHKSIKPILSVIVLLVGGGIAANIANGFVHISHLSQLDKLTPNKLNELNAWATDRILRPYALLVKERYIIPQPHNAKNEMKEANEMIYHLPMPKAMLDKAILMVFEGKDHQACELMKKVAYSFPDVLQQYNVLAKAYKDRGEKLPGNPAILELCIEKGAVKGLSSPQS